MKTFVRGVLCALMVMVAGLALAAPVEYVKVCSNYGAGYYYVPGTDICYNTTTGVSKVETEGGTWTTQESPGGEWVGRPFRACFPGKLVPLGTITPADLTLNSHSRYETAPLQITLGAGEFISRLMIRGGFAASSRSTFCFMYFDTPTSEYSVAGCAPTRMMADQNATWSFAPVRTAPPASFTGPFKLLGAAGAETWPLIENVTGELEAWACVSRVRP